MLYCAASNSMVIDAIVADYVSEFGRHVDVQYGGSQTLLSSIEVSGSGDLFLPADDSYLELARTKGLVDEILPIARMRALVVVRRGNPKSIETFADLLRDDVRIAAANPDTAAIGKVTRQALRRSDLWDKLDQATATYRTTVVEVANDVLVGAADAGVVYDAMLCNYPDLEAIQMSQLRPVTSDVAIGVLRSAQHPSAALHFARFLAATDRGQQRYAEQGFEVFGGDRWSDLVEQLNSADDREHD